MNKKGILICFVGIDGSGKSTLSKYVYEELKSRNYNVSYTWWLEGEDSFLRKLLRRVGSSSYSSGSKADNPYVERGNSSKKRIFRVLYPRIVLLDYFRFGILKTCHPRLRNTEVMIFDRYIYDVILALSKEFNFSEVRKERLFNIFGKLLANPDLIFVVDVPPEIAYSRKKDEIRSLETAKVLWKNYQELFARLSNLNTGQLLKIDNTRDIETVKEELLQTTLEFLAQKNDGT